MANNTNEIQVRERTGDLVDREVLLGAVPEHAPRRSRLIGSDGKRKSERSYLENMDHE